MNVKKSGDFFVTVVLVIVVVIVVYLAIRVCLFGYTTEIDGCEYISRGYALTHKGNCKYCEAKKEQSK